MFLIISRRHYSIYSKRQWPPIKIFSVKYSKTVSIKISPLLSKFSAIWYLNKTLHSELFLSNQTAAIPISVDSILKHIIRHIYITYPTYCTCALDKYFSLINQNPIIVPEACWALVFIWYEKLPQRWRIWKNSIVKSPIIPTYPCTGSSGAYNW